MQYEFVDVGLTVMLFVVSDEYALSVMNTFAASVFPARFDGMTHANVLATYSSVSATSNSITVSPTSTNSYCIGVTDSASTPVTELSSNDVVLVNVFITDSANTPETTNSVKTGTLTVIATAPTTPTLSNCP